MTELSTLSHLLETKISERQKQERKALIEKMEQMARERGFGGIRALLGVADEDTAPPKRKSSRTVAPKYRNPENADEVWTGRGRKPKWVEVALAGGASLEDLLIEGRGSDAA